MRRATQIYLTPDQHQALQDHARRSGRSMTEVVRDLIEAHLLRGGPPPTDLSELAGAVHTGRRTDVAAERDRMLSDAIGAVR
jgi:hypothetical protein